MEGFAMVVGEHLRKTYSTGQRQVEAVGGISLEVSAGQCLAMIGRSGSGKSTLLSMIGGLSRPSQGRVVLNGIDIWALSDDERTEFRNRRIGFVFQFSSLLPTLRAIDNVALPALLGRTQEPSVAYANAEEILNRVGLGERLESYPSALSGGEQRRVALARALINAPPLLLADEPTGDLDEETEAEIMALLLDRSRNEGTTLILVTHQVALAQQADRVMRIRQGSLVA